MHTFYEYQQARIIAEINNITLKEALILRENLISKFAQTFTRKYMLPAAVIAAIISGQGCGGNQCPTPQVQQQIQQDFNNQIQSSSATSPDAANYVGGNQKWTSPAAAKYVKGDNGNIPDQKWTSPDAAKYVKGAGNTVQNTTPVQQASSEIKQVGPNTYEVTGVGRESRLSLDHGIRQARMDAKSKLLKHLKLSQSSLHGEQIVSQKKEGGKTIVVIRINVGENPNPID